MVTTTNRVDSQGTPVNAYKFGTAENETISGTAATTAAKSAGLYLLTVNTDTHVLIGSAPTATSAHTLLPAGTAIPVILDEGDKVSGIQATAGGVMSLTPLV